MAKRILAQDEHDWREVFQKESGTHGYECFKCDLFMKYTSPALPVFGCVRNYSTMSQQDIRREVSGTEFWNEDKGDRN